MNSSRSSLQQPPSAVFKGLVITKQLSGSSQPVQNPIYTGMPSNINHSNRQFSTVDINPNPHVNHVPPVQVNTNEPHVQMRNNVRILTVVIYFES